MTSFTHRFYCALAVLLIPYSIFFLAQIVVGVAEAPKGMGKSTRHRDDPKGFWRLIGIQVLLVLALALSVAIFV